MDLKFKEVKELFDSKFRNQLQNEIQGFRYHYEGDEYTHTMMVVKEAYEKDYENEKEKWIYVLAAFLHDVAKSDVRVEKDGKIFHTGHSGTSVLKSINFLLQVRDIIGISYQDIITILYLINYHDAHWQFGNFRSIFQYYPNLYEKLKLFSSFDVKGRITQSELKNQSYPEDIEFILEENTPIDDSTNVVHILVGVPNSGKDTFLRSKGIGKSIIVSRDDILMDYGTEKYGDLIYSELWDILTKEDQEKINNLLWNKFTTLVRKQEKEIYVNLTNVSFSTRKKWITLAENYGYRIKFHTFLTDLDIVLRRNKKRFEEEGKNIPNVVLLDMSKRLQLPLPKYETLESEDVTYYVNNEIIVDNFVSKL
ncbi:MAG: ATP-binding protein [Nitrososphaerota archaeon]